MGLWDDFIIAHIIDKAFRKEEKPVEEFSAEKQRKADRQNAIFLVIVFIIVFAILYL